MPRDNDCIKKHRNGEHLKCGECSIPYVVNVYKIEEIGTALEYIKSILNLNINWRKYSDKITNKIFHIVHEGAMNSFEHGILGISKDEKMKMLSNNFNSYYKNVKDKLCMQDGVLITLCFNDDRLLFGFHDNGNGFDTKHVLEEIEKDFELDALKPSGRGLKMLKGSGVGLRWNQKGNSFFCTLSLPVKELAT